MLSVSILTERSPEKEPYQSSEEEEDIGGESSDEDFDESWNDSIVRESSPDVDNFKENCENVTNNEAQSSRIKEKRKENWTEYSGEEGEYDSTQEKLIMETIMQEQGEGPIKKTQQKNNINLPANGILDINNNIESVGVSQSRRSMEQKEAITKRYDQRAYLESKIEVTKGPNEERAQNSPLVGSRS
ncbi:hypothetical protein L2E82_29899 [Cichorium intybus]|uniref:Uncharacterized protein n=1 Tax=Cichorium intybus TaxID=13427 RepID=A0ACB9CYQ8_CICIN|nr:hypothetical protein L2E82_29899 [Cichorium intybus]